MTLQDMRGQGSPADIGTFVSPASTIIYQHTFSGTRYFVAARQGDRGWVLVAHGTDESTVINADITYVLATFGTGSIYIARGTVTYYIRTPIYIRGDIHIVGPGQGWAPPLLTLANGANCNMFEYTGAPDDYFFTLEHMACTGNKNNNASGYGLYVDSVGKFSDVTIRDVGFFTFVNDGLCTYNLGGWTLINVICESCDGNGFSIFAGVGINLIACRSLLNEGHGLQVGTSGHTVGCVTTLGGSFSVNTLYGINIFNGYGGTYTAPQVVANGQHGFYVDWIDNILMGCKVSGNGVTAANTYDGFFFTAYADGSICVGCSSDGVAQQRYGFNVSAGGCIDVIIDDYKAPNNVSGEINDAGTRTRINGLGREATGGAAPTAANWSMGDIVQDTDNPAKHWIKDYDGTFRQIA